MEKERESEFLEPNPVVAPPPPEEGVAGADLAGAGNQGSSYSAAATQPPGRVGSTSDIGQGDVSEHRAEHPAYTGDTANVSLIRKYIRWKLRGQYSLILYL